jgi:hypothetical protein
MPVIKIPPPLAKAAGDHARVASLRGFCQGPTGRGEAIAGMRRLRKFLALLAAALTA